MYFKFLLFFLLSCSLGATEYLQSDYSIQSDSVMLSDIVSEPQEDLLLYSIKKNKHTKRVKAKIVLQDLKKHGYKEYKSKHRFIQFTQKSPIDTSKIREELIKYYKSKYKSIKINSLFLEPRTYLEKLPPYYEFGIDEHAYLSSKDYCYILTPEKKRIFFSYTIAASIEVYYTKETLKRGTELSNLNTVKKSIMLSKFRAKPLETIEAHTLEAKHRLKKNSELTSRDVVGLYLVKRGENVNVTLKNRAINISFRATAVTSGRYGDTIIVQKGTDKKMEVRVIGHNRAEM